jgi:hypothetical protein
MDSQWIVQRIGIGWLAGGRTSGGLGLVHTRSVRMATLL